MRNNIKNRIISVLLACVLMLNQVPLFAAAEGTGLCEHHPVHEGCDYAEGEKGRECALVCSDCENTQEDICGLQGTALTNGTELADASESDNGPYAISTKAELNAIRDNLSGSYYLTRDIVFTESDYLEGGAFYNDGAGWEPIGTVEERFSGVLDGRGYAIVGLKTTGKDYAGLFAYLSGTVTNLTMKDVFVSGLWRSGAIAAAAMESATVTNCTVYGTVVTTSNDYHPGAGGFIGLCYENWEVPGGKILFENCHNYANVDATSTSTSDAHGGGIYGQASRTGPLTVNVIRCSNHGNITGTDRTGGIAGMCADKGQIVECYNAGAITSNNSYDYTGGICGIADGYSSAGSKIINCYNAGTITAKSYAGGIAGGYHEVTIEECYNVGALSASNRYGIGTDSTTGQDQVLLNNYTISPYYLTRKDGSTVYTNWSDSEMQQQETYQGFDFENIWFIDGNTDYPYPQLRANVQNTIAEISVETQPDCAVFIEGRKPDLTGATAKVTYKSGATAIIAVTENMLWDIDYGQPGLQEIHVHYAGVTSQNTIAFQVTSKDIELTALPDKLVYLEGKDVLDMSGAELTVTYGDGSSEVIAVTESMVSGFDNTVVGVQTLTVAFEEKTVTFEIEVKAKTLIEIRVPVLPLKLTYVQGQPIDPDGGVLELIYDNDTVERKALTLALLTVSPEAIGDAPVTVSYGGQETTFTVCVEPRVVKSVVITLPEKREYTVGEELDLTGGMITTVFESDDDYTETIPLDVSMVSGYDNSTPSRQTLKITYLEYTETFDIFVHVGEHDIVVAADLYPESSHPYGNNWDETKTFIYEGAKSLTITFSSNTRLDNYFDIIYIYDGAGNRIAEYRGAEAANRVLEIPGDTFDIRLTSNSSATSYGYAFSSIVAHMDVVHPPVVDAATATCTQSGLTEGSHCEICGKVLIEQVYTEALGHDFGEWYSTEDATCMEDGLQRRDCSRCDHYETEAVDKLGHHFGDWYTVTAAACTEDGQQRRDCGRCDHYETQVLTKLGHDYKSVVTAPTCTEDGYTTHTCSVCGYSYADSEVEATGHDWKAATCTEPKVCKTCGETEGEAAGHSYVNGFCSRCDGFEPCTDSDGDGYYEIGNGGQLYWFAANAAKTDNAVLTGDIYVNQGDLTNYDGSSENTWRVWNAIGDYYDPYKGVFDGQGYTISGLYHKANPYREEEYFGIFGRITGTVRDLGIVNTYFDHWTYFGGIVGYNSGTIERCYFDGTLMGYEYVGGIAGYNYGIIRNCYNSGRVNGSLSVGGIAGASYKTLENCHNVGTVSAVLYYCGSIAGRGSATNCYYLENSASDKTTVQNGIGAEEKGKVTADVEGTTTVKTAAVFESGEVTWLLNGETPDGVWKQTLGQHEYPVFSGQTVYYGYSDCSDNTAEYSNEVRYMQNPHNWKDGVCVDCGAHCQHAGGEATCTEKAVCEICFAEYGDSLGHDFGDWKTTKEANCTEDGQQRRDCRRCDNFETQVLTMLGHDYKSVITDPTCTEGGYTTHTCSRCADTYTDAPAEALGHDLGALETTKPATCTEDGEQWRRCRRCDYFETQLLPKLDHDYKSVVTDPTCTEAGYTTHTCARCNNTYTDAPVAALDHAWDKGKITVEPTEETEGEMLYTCERCGDTKTEVIPELEHTHSYEAVVTAPTCTEQGSTAYTCRCGDSYVQDYVEALGHDMGAWEITKEATCTEDGEQRRDCARCDHYETQAVDALGHNYVDGVCTRCGEKDPDYVAPAPETADIFRLSGKDRYLTAFSVADQLKGNLGITRFDCVVVAYGQNFPDALTGSYLAAVKNAPILLTNDSVHADVVSYITMNMDFDGTVYILGGAGAVSQDFEDRLIELDITYKRLSGKNRYGTNLEILKEAGIDPNAEILIATGTNYADSLSASATGLPMLLVGPSLSAEQKEFLEGTSGKFVIIGGTGAVSEAVEAELAQIGTVERIKGKTRYETSVVIAQRYFTNPEAAVLAYAQGFPDGLCGGPLAVSMGAPLILTSNEAPTTADSYIEGITVGAVTGGTGRISDDTVRAIFDLADDVEIPKK